jgi:predicted nucleotidyltransferase
VFYQANPDCPIFGELKGLMVKTTGAADVLRAALAPLAAQMRVAFIYGSVAKLTQRSGSDVDVMVVGELAFGEVVSALGSAQEALLAVGLGGARGNRTPNQPRGPPSSRDRVSGIHDRGR